MEEREPEGRKVDFLFGCFGFSRKIYSRKEKPGDGGGGGKKKTKKRMRPKKPGWFSWLRPRRKTDEAKTIPFDSTDSEAAKPPSDGPTPVSHGACSDQVQHPRPQETKHEHGKDDNNLESRSNSNSSETRRPSFCQRAKTGKPRTETAHVARRPSFSAEVPTRPRNARRGNGVTGEKYDPLLGLSIVAMTLVVMILWGRVCAILCTSAWCYFLPRLRKLRGNASRPSAQDPAPDLDSEEHKMSVVLQGFLAREKNNRHCTV